ASRKDTATASKTAATQTIAWLKPPNSEQAAADRTASAPRLEACLEYAPDTSGRTLLRCSTACHSDAA
ncbi:hypothetical protein O181_057220, partial [Austropuccinia psidii MF-1]|nr:hypothetical protein [Austropuccinia psidii MF-1]